MVFQFTLQDPVEQKSDKYDKEMCADPVFACQVNRPCPHFCFCYSEGFLYLPSSFCDLQDIGGFRLFKVMHGGVKTVIYRFPGNGFFVDEIFRPGGLFPAPGPALRLYKPPEVVLVFSLNLCPALFNCAFCPFDLRIPYISCVIPVFKGESHQQSLVKGDIPLLVVRFNIFFFIKDPVIVFVPAFIGLFQLGDVILPFERPVFTFHKPSGRGEAPFSILCGHLLYRNCCDKGPAGKVVELPVLLAGKA